MRPVSTLFHAHDSIWRDRSITLKERIQSTDIIVNCIISCIRKVQVSREKERDVDN
jgi:hypothetical protein